MMRTPEHRDSEEHLTNESRLLARNATQRSGTSVELRCRGKIWSWREEGGCDFVDEDLLLLDLVAGKVELQECL
jgi:hypothetical protein